MATRLEKLTAALLLLQGLIGVGVPLMQFFLVFNMQLGRMHLLITTSTCAVIAAALGLASTLSKGPALPALHVTAAILLAALMGAFNTQTFLDLDSRCNIQQAAMAGCSTCPCAATSSCAEKDLATDAACAGCRALGTDLCARVRWLPLLMPFTGLIEAVVLALPAFLSLLLLLQRGSGGGSGGSACMAVVDAGGQGGDDVTVLVNAWPGHGSSEPGDRPSATPVEEPSAGAVQRAPSTRTKKSASKHLVAEPSWQQEQSAHELGLDGMQGGGGAHDSMGHEYGGGYGLEANASSYVGSEHSGSMAAAAAPAKKKASTTAGLKKKLKSSVTAARTEASIGSGY